MKLRKELFGKQSPGEEERVISDKQRHLHIPAMLADKTALFSESTLHRPLDFTSLKYLFFSKKKITPVGR